MVDENISIEEAKFDRTIEALLKVDGILSSEFDNFQDYGCNKIWNRRFSASG